MNTFKVIIKGTEYTANAGYPLKWCDLLDERLDEAYITLKFTKVAEPFAPLTFQALST